ncbi:hypothetical protein [Acinetobacter guillouiae]|uniref:hypothetical protein n=1 Tax=Acinetobacter guillouiae TaxID=106649 RepID=UPI0026E19F1C|nr:hypothetical protein [Acinetobacter guillouiae]MDO6642630.1 hypothetical protein [Acinetobacter guillouiae]
MNMNVSEHQRSILATMGIELWIPKVDVQTRHYENALYRDIAQVEQDIAVVPELNTHLTQSDAKLENQKVQPPQIEKAHQPEVSLLKRNPETQLTEEVSAPEQIQQQTNFTVEPALQIAPFEIQAYCIESCVIFVDCTQISADQFTLWGNIQQALVGQFYDLKWPFPMLQLQDGRGAAMYIQGFVDALRQERKVISLGQLPYLNNTEMFELASLQEMIEQPLLKRRLWQFMQNKLN